MLRIVPRQAYQVAEILLHNSTTGPGLLRHQDMGDRPGSLRHGASQGNGFDGARGLRNTESWKNAGGIRVLK